MNIKTKVILLFLPLLVASVSITGVISSFTSRRSMTRVAIRLLGFKADELARFAERQWDLLVANDLNNEPAFIDAAKRAVQSYAMTVISEDTELIIAIGSDNRIAFSTGGNSVEESEISGLIADLTDKKRGWIDVFFEGSQRVGMAFYIDPLQWHILVTDKKAEFYSDVNRILISNGVAVITLSALTVFLAILFSLYLTRPINAVLNAIVAMSSRSDFKVKVPVLYNDEIGMLAHQFNLMNQELTSTYTQVKRYAANEVFARRTVDSREAETLRVLGRAAEFRDRNTGVHTVRVGLYARLIAEALETEEVDPEVIYRAAPLHDIGKLGIPDTILLKAGALTLREFEIMKSHTVIGAEILGQAESAYLQAGRVIALTHHEKFDGSGYPEGLSGESIPLLGRIVGLIDVFDAVTSKRPYKEPWPLSAALQHLVEEKGRHFDPKIVDHFVSRFEEVKAIRAKYSPE